MKVIPFILLLVLGRVEYADKDGLHWSWVSFYNVVRFWVGVIPGLSPKLGNKMMGREFFLLFFVVLLWWSQGASILVLYMTSSILIVEAFFGAFHGTQNFPDQGSNLCPLQWKQNILTIGPLGKSDGLNSLVILHFLHLFNKYLLKATYVC